MKFFETNTGKIYSAAELNGTFTNLKKKYPWLSPDFYRHKMETESGLVQITRSLVKRLVKARRFTDAMAVMQEEQEISADEAKFTVYLLAQDMGVLA